MAGTTQALLTLDDVASNGLPKPVAIMSLVHALVKVVLPPGPPIRISLQANVMNGIMFHIIPPGPLQVPGPIQMTVKICTGVNSTGLLTAASIQIVEARGGGAPPETGPMRQDLVQRELRRLRQLGR